jgi:signal transduction histidine kinase/ABC-type nitrate/sulfonate/bicarbonate transport system substrate-binding protein
LKLFFILLISAQLFAAHIESLEKVSLQLHWRYQFEFAGFIAAKEKGFYKEAGLDVELREYKFGINIVDEVLSQRATYGIYNSNILIDYLQNRNITLLASYFKRSALVIITKPYIKSAKDLVGKNIMAAGKEDFDLNFKPLFDNYGINTNSLHFIKHTYDVNDFIKDKNIDAMTAFITDQPYKLDKLGYKYNIINPSDYGTFNLQLELFTSQQEISEDKNRTIRFRDATNKGWAYAFAHQEEIVNLIHKKYAPAIGIDDLRNEAKEIEKQILPYTYSIGSIDENFLSRQAEIFKENYHINSDKKIENFALIDHKEKHVSLSKNESSYLAKHKNIRVCLQYDQFPYDSYTNQNYTGVMGDFYRIVQKDLDLNFIPVISHTEDELHVRVKNHECDLLSFVPTQTHAYPELTITQPIIESHFTLIGKLDKSFIQDPQTLRGKKLLVQFLAYKEHLLSIYPYLDISVEPNMNNIMSKVLSDKAFAAVTTAIRADYIIDQYGYGKLKINGFLAKNAPVTLGVGVQKSDPELFSIMQKEIDNIPKSKLETVLNNWSLKGYQEHPNYDLIMKILAVLGIIFGIMIFYQRKLKRFNSELAVLVDIKTKELQSINESLEQTVQEKIDELLQKDKLLTIQSKQAVMGEMISMIAHQWRQPLSTITLQISNLQIRKMMGKLESESEYEEALEKISETIIYLSETIDDFQTYFRPDKKHTTVEMHELLHKVNNFVIARVQKKGIDVQVQESHSIIAKVYVNELLQVILNIVNNAIDALEESLKENKKVIMGVEDKQEELCIKIEDNADGIAPENIEKLFNPYFSTKGKNGTGLGLYMSKMIIEKQFLGKIEVETSSEGTIFIIKIPKHEI